MRTLSKIAIVAGLATSCAYGQTTQDTQPAAIPALGPIDTAQQQGSAPREPAPVPIDRPPGALTLGPLSQEDQAAMAHSQLQTYRYNQLTEQALALKKLCETGFGPTDICPKATASGAQSSDAPLVAGPNELPTVAEINGSQNALSAVLVLEDGRRVTVHTGSVLPDGLKVAHVTADDVRVANGNGHEATLYFGGSPQAK
jgi:type IV pilus biogenesis protein PilP